MTEKPGRAAHARTFVVRVVVDEHTGVHGQASEPGSADEWHVTAASLAELWDRLEQRLGLAPPARPAESTEGDPAGLGWDKRID
jgi:hypothetical protein